MREREKKGRTNLAVRSIILFFFTFLLLLSAISFIESKVETKTIQWLSRVESIKSDPIRRKEMKGRRRRTGTDNLSETLKREETWWRWSRSCSISISFDRPMVFEYARTPFQIKLVCSATAAALAIENSKALKDKIVSLIRWIEKKRDNAFG